MSEFANEGELNSQQIAFCYEYIANNFNGRNAAKAAGYSPNTAAEQASRLLNNAKVKAKIEQLTESHLNKINITGEKILKELALLGFSDIKDYFKVEADGQINAYDFTELGPASKAIKKVKYTQHKIGGKVTGAEVELQTHNKISALKLMGEHLGLFEKDSHGDTNIGIQIVVDDNNVGEAMTAAMNAIKNDKGIQSDSQE